MSEHNDCSGAVWRQRQTLRGGGGGGAVWGKVDFMAVNDMWTSNLNFSSHHFLPFHNSPFVGYLNSNTSANDFSFCGRGRGHTFRELLVRRENESPFFPPLFFLDLCLLCTMWTSARTELERSYCKSWTGSADPSRVLTAVTALKEPTIFKSWASFHISMNKKGKLFLRKALLASDALFWVQSLHPECRERDEFKLWDRSVTVNTFCSQLFYQTTQTGLWKMGLTQPPLLLLLFF